jgi:menaquinone-dependent protoporphyrinogen oxidase
MDLINRKEFLFIMKSIVCSLFFFGIGPLSLFGKNEYGPTVPLKKETKKILIIYASLHGSTAQIAEFMGEKLKKEGIIVAVKSIEDDIDFSSYSGTIMGAPIHRGKWMDGAVEFVKKNRIEFDQLPFVCFYTCMSKAKQPPSQQTLKELASYQTAMSELFPTIVHSNIGSFAGMLDYEKCNFLTKLVMWFIMRKNSLEAGDYRDWKAIESWLSDVKRYLISVNKNANVSYLPTKKT